MNEDLTALDIVENDAELYEYLLNRVGKAHLRQRLGIETEHAADRFGQGRTFFHIENWRLASTLINFALRISGLSARGRANVENFEVCRNQLVLPNLPVNFKGYTVLQLSDLHLDILESFPGRLAESVSDLKYDVCVLTGDYRFATHGAHQKAVDGLAQLCEAIGSEIYAILGNHDSLLMSKQIEDLGIKLLLNEHAVLQREGAALYLAGIDDPHYFSADNLEKAYEGIPDDGVSVLLSHSPEIYRHAAYVGFDVMLCGHTHGGQICLPGSVALTYNSSAPRFTGVGAWRYDLMHGYTSRGTGSSVVPARFNCRPEITLHQLSSS